MNTQNSTEKTAGDAAPVSASRDAVSLLMGRVDAARYGFASTELHQLEELYQLCCAAYRVHEGFYPRAKDMNTEARRVRQCLAQCRGSARGLLSRRLAELSAA